jgi:hypothetical protein
MPTLICKNCNTHFRGNFCSHCGQSANVNKINAAYFLHDIPHSVFHIDKGFFYTLKSLITKPGIALREYLNGHRIKHYRPFAFVIIMSTICTVIIKGVNYLTNKLYTENNPGSSIHYGDNIFVKYPSLLIFLMIPILSFITWLFFKKKNFNYWEHFLINTYLAAYVNVFFLVLSIFQFIKYYFTQNYSVNFTVFMVFFMAYYGFAFGSLMASPGKRYRHIFIICIMNFFLAFIYLTAFSITKIMQPWWGA